jgi:ATP adenylyltransferase
MKKPKQKKKKVVDPRFAKSAEYKAVISAIKKEGECPFCPSNFKYHKHPILKRAHDWFISKSSWPYENAKHHFILLKVFHREHIKELSYDDMNGVLALTQWATKEFGLKGGALAMRFGDTAYTGATVCHLHFHLIVPKKGKTVNFPIG